ncbi:hypothetical protein B9Z55_012475 [Caenorhabditis nigoni]|uniref:Uncharacterized protein n=1 Tax=Caenorhabditis nigoni TaxID=1611254 RepID=A0A2G5TXB7_9PELO|nr:hypothetical protein B9Z55_012475 [Caenorhabditis nigoni]
MSVASFLSKSHRLETLGEVKEVVRYGPHLLAQRHLETGVDTCLNLLILRCTNEWWNQIITSSDKWVMYDYNKRQTKWVDKGAYPPDVSKHENRHKNGLLWIWWSTKEWSIESC